MTRYVERIVTLAFALVAGVVVFALWMAYRNSVELRQSNVLVWHTYEVLDSLQSSLTSMIDAETGLREFLITSQEQSLQPYQEAKPRVSSGLDRLKSLTADDPSQQPQLEALEQLFSDQFQILDGIIGNVRSGGAGGAGPTASADVAQSLDRIRRSIADMQAAARERLSAQANAASDERVVLRVGSLLAALVFVCLIAALLIVRHHIAARGAMMSEIQQLNAILEQRVEERTAQSAAANHALTREVEEHHQTLHRLRLSDFSVDHASVGNFWIAPDGHLLRVNQTFCEMVGWSEPELLRMTMSDVNPQFTPDNWPAHWEALRAQGHMRFESSMRRQDGTLLPVDVDLNWLEFDGEEYDFAFVRDITQRKKSDELLRTLNTDLEQRVQDRTAALKDANEELEAFSYSVSHDLRAPLRHVQGFLDLMAKDTGSQLSTKSERYLSIVVQSSGKMGRLIDDLLAFSRTARTELRQMRVELDDLVEETLGQVQADLDGRMIEFKRGPMPAVMADPMLLRQVLANLVENAVKYTRPSEPAIIEIGAHTDDEDEVVVFVRDNGVGFDMQYADKLFGVFQRLHRAEDFEGTGIGLANVRRIVARHGGRVWAESAPGKGATFYFTLPSAASAVMEAS